MRLDDIIICLHQIVVLYLRGLVFVSITLYLYLLYCIYFNELYSFIVYFSLNFDSIGLS